MLSRETIAAYRKNEKKHANTLAYGKLFNIKPCGKLSLVFEKLTKKV